MEGSSRGRLLLLTGTQCQSPFLPSPVEPRNAFKYLGESYRQQQGFDRYLKHLALSSATSSQNYDTLWAGVEKKSRSICWQ